MAPRRTTFNLGAVGIVDALGFKNVWNSGDPSRPSLEAINTLRAIEASVQKKIDEFDHWLSKPRYLKSVGLDRFAKAPKVEARFLSDSIVVAAYTKPRRRPNKRHIAESHSQTGMDHDDSVAALHDIFRQAVVYCIADILRTAILATKPLAFRGVVTFGRFLVDKNFLIGPAIDEAASLAESADGAFVWLTPSANFKQHVVWKTQPKWGQILRNHTVKLNDGRAISAPTVNVRAVCTLAERGLLNAAFGKAMQSNLLDVIIKRQNTKAMLRRFELLDRKIDEQEKLDLIARKTTIDRALEQLQKTPDKYLKKCLPNRMNG